MSAHKIDYWKILYTGSILSVFFSIISFFVLVYFIQDTETILLACAVGAVLFNTSYFFIFIKFFETVEAKSESEDSLNDFINNINLITSWKRTSYRSKRAIIVFIFFILLLAFGILISIALGGPCYR